MRLSLLSFLFTALAVQGAAPDIADFKQTGSAERRAMGLFPVYRIHHFVELTENGSGENPDAVEKKAVEMIFLRSLSGQRISDAISIAVKERVPNAEWEKLQDDLARFCTPLNGASMARDDRYLLIRHSHGLLEGWFEGEIFQEIKNPALAQAIWSIWIGEDSLVDRRTLLGNWTCDETEAGKLSQNAGLME